MRINKITAISHAGILDSFTRAQQSLELVRFGLIYGYNGTGKSTVAKLFSALAGEPREKLGLQEDCSFSVELDDGRHVSLKDLDSELSLRLHVYNDHSYTAYLVHMPLIPISRALTAKLVWTGADHAISFGICLIITLLLTFCFFLLLHFGIE